MTQFSIHDRPNYEPPEHPDEARAREEAMGEKRAAEWPVGRCEGCGEVAKADHESGGDYGHTRSEHAPDCNCNDWNPTPTCPIPVSCGPIRPTTDPDTPEGGEHAE